VKRGTYATVVDTWDGDKRARGTATTVDNLDLRAADVELGYSPVYELLVNCEDNWISPPPKLDALCKAICSTRTRYSPLGKLEGMLKVNLSTSVSS